MFKFSKFAAAAVLLAATASVSFGQTAVGVLNPNQATGTAAGQVTNSPNGSLNPNFIGIDAFRTLVAAAFTAGRGGVADFAETAAPPSGTPPVAGTFPTGTFGVAGSPLPVNFAGSSIGLSRFSSVQPSDPAGTAALALDAATGNNSAYSSGTSYLGFQSIARPGLVLTPISITPGFGITAVGFTILERGAARTISVSYTLDDGTVAALVGTPVAGTPATGTVGAGGADALTSGGASIFYGFQAPVGRTISVVNYSDATLQALRVDDLAVITSAVPEPTSLATLAVGGLVALRRRRAR